MIVVIVVVVLVSVVVIVLLAFFVAMYIRYVCYLAVSHRVYVRSAVYANVGSVCDVLILRSTLLSLHCHCYWICP